MFGSFLFLIIGIIKITAISLVFATANRRFRRYILCRSCRFLGLFLFTQFFFGFSFLLFQLCRALRSIFFQLCFFSFFFSMGSFSQRFIIDRLGRRRINYRLFNFRHRGFRRFFCLSSANIGSFLANLNVDRSATSCATPGFQGT